MAFKKRESVTVFDIEDDRIKLGLVNIDDNRRTLSRLISIKIREKAPAGLTKAIRKIVSDYKLADSHVIVNIQRYRVTVKSIKLPSTNPAEIESMVGLQAAKQLPFSPEKIIFSYRVLGRDARGYSDVMMALLHRDAVEKILKVFDQAGLGVERLALSSEGLNLWYTGRQKPEEKSACICLIDIGMSFLELQVIRNGGLDFTRSISFSSPEDMEKRVLDEIKKSFFTFRKSSHGLKIDKLVLTGRRSVLEKEAPLLKKDLGLPMVYVDPVKQWPRSEDAILPSTKEFSSESFAAVAALGFNYDKLQTDFIPQEIRLKKLSKVARENLLISATLLLCILLGTGGIFTKNYIDKRRYLASIQRRLRQLDFKGSGIDVLRELYSNMPSEISLSIFDYEDGRSCLLRGTSQKLSDVFKFISLLEDSAYFENVKVRYATKRVVGKKELTDFEVICQLAAVKKE
jgi:Tfp pilus assembly PilM family ATPase